MQGIFSQILDFPHLTAVSTSLAWALRILLHFWATMSLCNNTSCIVADIVSYSLLVFSTIVALGVLLFFKMYHKFIYRLLLYAFVALIISSTSWTACLHTIIKVQSQWTDFTKPSAGHAHIVLVYIKVAACKEPGCLFAGCSKKIMHILHD